MKLTSFSLATVSISFFFFSARHFSILSLLLTISSSNLACSLSLSSFYHNTTLGLHRYTQPTNQPQQPPHPPWTRPLCHSPCRDPGCFPWNWSHWSCCLCLFSYLSLNQIFGKNLKKKQFNTILDNQSGLFWVKIQ